MTKKDDDPAQNSVNRVHAFVSGRVQGVCFRAYTQEEALRLKLSGWVRNLPDRRVEYVAEGPREALEALVEWSRRGPTWARVKTVEAVWEEAPQGETGGFRIEY